MSTDDALTRLTDGLDRDEAIARAATQDESTYWAADHGHVFITMDASWYEDEMIVTAADISDRLAYQRAEHIARHDPKREFAEVALKRLILREHRPQEMDDGTYCTECSTSLSLNIDEVPWPCEYIRALAGIYDTTEEPEP